MERTRENLRQNLELKKRQKNFSQPEMEKMQIQEAQ